MCVKERDSVRVGGRERETENVSEFKVRAKRERGLNTIEISLLGTSLSLSLSLSFEVNFFLSLGIERNWYPTDTDISHYITVAKETLLNTNMVAPIIRKLENTLHLGKFIHAVRINVGDSEIHCQLI